MKRTRAEAVSIHATSPLFSSASSDAVAYVGLLDAAHRLMPRNDAREPVAASFPRLMPGLRIDGFDGFAAYGAAPVGASYDPGTMSSRIQNWSS